jgi:AcrR family transcriptional regulator
MWRHEVDTSGEALADSEAPSSGSGRREAIVAAAAELFARKGVASTTVRDIGRAVGMLSGSLYYYFDSKEAIVAEILFEYLRPMLDAFDEVVVKYDDPRQRLAELIRAECEATEGHESAAEIFSHEFKYLLQPAYAAVRKVTEGARDRYLDTITDGVRRGFFRDDVDAMLFYGFVRTSVGLMVRSWGALESEPYHVSGRSGRYSVDQFTHDCVAILLEGFVVRSSTTPRKRSRSTTSRQATGR